MRGLATLLRLSTNRTEQARLALAGAIRARAEAEAELGRHAEAIAAEPAPAAESPDQLRDWSAWRDAAGRAERALQAALAAQAGREAACRDAMRESLAEGKRLELAQVAELQALRRRAQRRREAASEETALQRRHPA